MEPPSVDQAALQGSYCVHEQHSTGETERSRPACVSDDSRQDRGDKVSRVALALALFIACNVRLYVSVPDPQTDMHAHTGVVVIVPNIDLCYGVELEHETFHVDPFGGECE